VGTDAPKGKGREIKTMQKMGAGKTARWRFRPLALLVLAFSAMVATARSAGPVQSSVSQEEFLLGMVSISAGELNNARSIGCAKEVAKYTGWKVEVGDANGSAEKANTAMRNAPMREIAPGLIIGDPG
jgi:hypothetical protein